MTDPAGVAWVVALEWEGRRARDAVGKVGSRVGSVRDRRTQQQLAREQAAARARDRGEKPKKDRFDPLDALDVLDLGDLLEGGPLALVVIVVILVFLLLVFGLPLLIALVAALAEAALLALLALLAFLVRTLRRRPWRVTATASDGRRHAWDQVGWRASRALVRQLVAAIEAGLPPTSVAGDRLRVEG